MSPCPDRAQEATQSILSGEPGTRVLSRPVENGGRPFWPGEENVCAGGG